MVAPPPVTDVYQVTTIGLLNNMPCDHVINYHVPGLATSAGAVAAELALSDSVHWMAVFGGALPPYYTHVSSKCTYLGTPSPAPAVHTAGLSGTSARVFGSHATCVTIRHSVNVRGKGKDGRTNFPGPSVDGIDQPAGTLGLAYRNAVDQDWANYQVAIQTDMVNTFGVTPTLVVLDRKLGTFNTPVSFDTDLFPNTHRRWQKRLARH